MPILQDQDVAIWCCRNGDLYQVIEWRVGDPEPIQKFCSKCGEKFVTRCPKKSCPDPTYHPSDVNANVHGPCGTKIPWAEARNNAVIIGPGFQSKLIGSGSYMGTSRRISQNTREITRGAQEEARAASLDPRVKVIYGLGSGKSGLLTRVVAEYLANANDAIDKPPRKVVRAVISFLKGRGERVGRGADKGLEDAATWTVKMVVLAIVLAVIGFFGWQVFFRPLIPGL